MDTTEVQINNVTGFLDSTSSPKGSERIYSTVTSREARRIRADLLLPSRFFYSSSMACTVALREEKYSNFVI